MKWIELSDSEKIVIGDSDGALIFRENGTFDVIIPTQKDADMLALPHSVVITSLAILLEDSEFEEPFFELLHKAFAKGMQKALSGEDQIK